MVHRRSSGRPLPTQLGSATHMEAVQRGKRAAALQQRWDRGARTTPRRQQVVGLVRAAAQQARTALVDLHMGLATAIAKRYARACAVPLADLTQEAAIGLLTAIDRFDPTRGVPFSGYAGTVIQSVVVHYITLNRRSMRLPYDMCLQIFQVHHAHAMLLLRLNREPTLAELAAETGLSVGRIGVILDHDQRTDVVSLDCPYPGTDERVGVLGDRVPLDIDIEATVVAQVSADDVHQALCSIPARTAQCLRSRYGINSPQLSRNELAEHYATSSWTVRQIWNDGLAALRTNPILRDHDTVQHRDWGGH